MNEDDLIVQRLIELTKENTAFSDVRFGTKKLPIDYKPKPKVEVIIFSTTSGTSVERAHQNNKTLLMSGLVIGHVYANSDSQSENIAKLVCQLLDGITIKPLRLVNVNEWPRLISTNPQEAVTYFNLDWLK